MKIFDKAILKLTAIFVAILFVICFGFSAAVYNVTTRGLERDLPRRVMITGDDEMMVERFLTEHFEQIRANLLTELVLVNLAVLAAGAAASYFLARWTLMPVNAAMQAQGRFVSDASHELRTPLAAIQMENEVLLREARPNRDELRAQIVSNLEEVGKLRELTDRLLRLSQNEPIEISEIDVGQAVRAALKRVEPQIAARKIVVKNLVKSRRIRANHEALADILAILLDNAVKYSPRGSVVTIGATRDGKIFVRDAGSGIAPVDLPHIFDRFYRAETSRTTDGYGLGLPLAQAVASQMNMQIVAENNKKSGATFTLG
ncbi:MAG: HAMP domain-containing histidine kinase [Candidatus Nomurabacteria bacterium]|nr:HAMP domain-containing histidine kinase [Candidatus Nomurabacteria bacterium]